MNEYFNQKAKTEIIAKFRPLICKTAYRYLLANPEDELEDFIQLGILGLLKAFKRFNALKSYNGEFSFEYAQSFIKGEIKHYIRDKSLIKYPRKIGVRPKLKSLESLDLNLLADQSEDYEDYFELYQAILSLSSQEKTVLLLYYFQGKTQKEIATILNRTAMTVARIRKKAERRIGSLLCTKTEAVVIDQLSQGLSNEEIADNMKISKRTIETHVNNILTKNNLQNRVQIASNYYQAQLKINIKRIEELEKELMELQRQQQTFKNQLDNFQERLNLLKH